MKRLTKTETVMIVSLVTMALCAYIAAYCATTEIFHGQFGNTKMDFRLFDSPGHMEVFFPLIAIEERMRSQRTGRSELEFYGHIRNGASLPPPRAVENEPQRQ